MQDPMSLDPPRLALALQFAAREQPSLARCLSVASLVLQSGGDPEQTLAALLQGVSRSGQLPEQAVADSFGAETARLLASTAEPTDPGPRASPEGSPAAARASQVQAWREGRQDYLLRLGSLGERELLIVTCREFQEVRDLVQELKYQGPSVWKRFGTQPLELFWYFREVLQLAYGKLDRARHRALLGEFAAALQSLKASAGAS